MNAKKNPADPIKLALTQTTRALAGERKLELQFTNEAPTELGAVKRMPTFSRQIKPEEVLRARGAADSFGFFHRHHDREIAAQHQFENADATRIFNALERSRCELRGGRDLPGALGNIDTQRASDLAALGQAERDDIDIAEAMALWLRAHANETPLPEASQKRLDLWQEQLDQEAGAALEALVHKIDDQNAFDIAIRDVLDAVGFDLPSNDPTPAQDEEESEEEDDQTDVESTGEDDSDTEDEPQASDSSEEEDKNESDASISDDDQADQEGDPSDAPPR